MPLTASNITNIDAGKEVAATPDGRKAGTPLSDAASPMFGKDISGVTSTLLSVSKPDYNFSGGAVVNQKFSPSVFETKESRDKLKALLKVYFARGGQEIQINSISREILTDAMETPEKYKSLVTRVSGFSAFYTALHKSVQEDILRRTEHKA
jgi:formate C-acetyltransferase